MTFLNSYEEAYDSAMSKDEQSKGKPLAIDHNATSASPTEPVFVARSKGRLSTTDSLYSKTECRGVHFRSAITGFEAEPAENGDALGSRPMGVVLVLRGKSPRRSTLRKYGHSSERGRAFGLSRSHIRWTIGQTLARICLLCCPT